MSLTSVTTSNHTITVQDLGEGYAMVTLELPPPIGEVQFTFASGKEAQTFVKALKKTIWIESPLTNP